MAISQLGFRVVMKWFLLGSVVVLGIGYFYLCQIMKAVSQPVAGALYGKIYQSRHRSPTPVLVVVLHGDAPFNQPVYQYLFAQRIAQQTDNVVAIGLLRPGYTDPDHRRSPGERGLTVGDNYTAAVIDAVRARILSLQQVYHPRKIIVAGHSGGAVLAANLASCYPGLVQAVLLVSCPCDVPAFRRHMAQEQHSPFWLLPTQSLSPLALIDSLRPPLQVRLITGLADSIALPSYSRAYAARIKQRGVSVDLILVKEGGHELFLEKEVFLQLKKLIIEAN